MHIQVVESRQSISKLHFKKVAVFFSHMDFLNSKLMWITKTKRMFEETRINYINIRMDLFDADTDFSKVDNL